jgi:hypothetical protein
MIFFSHFVSFLVGLMLGVYFGFVGILIYALFDMRASVKVVRVNLGKKKIN